MEMYGSADANRMGRILPNLFGVKIVASCCGDCFYDAVDTGIGDVRPSRTTFAPFVDREWLIGWNSMATCPLNDPLHSGNAIELGVKEVLGKGFFLIVLAVLLNPPGDVHEDC